MAQREVDPSDLLKYNPTYKLLICRECRYAIQKSAIDSHLLRHKIYRRERQRLLEYAAHFDILEPYLVPLPKAGSPAISALTVSDGLRCDFSDCGHLAISAKRMQKHWYDAHGHGNAVSLLSSFSRPVKLQTFFRGTQNRYFEVVLAPESDLSQAEEGREISADDQKVNQSAIICRHENLEPYNLDMQILRYLHHFSTLTYATLPALDHSAGQQYWNLYVLPLALERQWLMFGLLALAAFHMAFEAKDARLIAEHVKIASSFSCNFAHAFGSATALEMTNDAEIQPVSEQIKALLYLAECAVSRKGATDSSRLECSLLAASEILERCASNIGVSKSNAIPQGAVSSVMLDQLHALPDRIAEVFRRPSDPEDVFSILLAIGSLISCYQSSSHIDNAISAWQDISRWVAERPKSFTELVSKSDPAALVVTAFWYAALVKPLEYSWYMHSISAMALSTIRGQLSRLQMHDILPLLDGLF